MDSVRIMSELKRQTAPGEPELVGFLRQPRNYPERPHSVEVVETHFAWVFLTDRHAYKMKKSMRQDIMDYRTLARRERGCRNELELNSRLASEVYLDVVPLSRTRQGGLKLGQGAQVLEWLIRMQRLESARMLDAAIAAGTLKARMLDPLMSRLCGFFRMATARPMPARAYLARLRMRSLQDARELRAPDLRLDLTFLDEIIDGHLSFMERAHGLVGERGARLVDGHGDLRPEHIYVGSESRRPCVIDCLEFNSDLRRLDPAEEMAFLALECVRLDAPAIARGLLNRYERLMPGRVSRALFYFYMSQRALTRAKVTAWHLKDPRLAHRRRRWIEKTDSYLSNALRYSRSALKGARAGRFRWGSRCDGPEEPFGSARAHYASATVAPA